LRPESTWDVAVVGAGPAGSAAAFWLAKAGWRVVVAEQKHFPRPKTCGDGLTPRAVRQLVDMGLGSFLESKHKFRGLRAIASNRSLELAWPPHPGLPSHGYVVERKVLDFAVAEAARAQGAHFLFGHRASPWLDENGELAGVLVEDGSSARQLRLKASYVIVADGSNSRVGRELGAKRDKSLPLGLAQRGYWQTSRPADSWIESHLELADPSGRIIPGYGWVFPMGNGLANVGIGVLSAPRGLNTNRLLANFVASVKDRWGLSAEPVALPTGGKLPMGLSVRPVIGKRHLLVGDAAGSINPFNGEGIAYAYETGRLAAWAVGHALARGDSAALRLYAGALEDRLFSYYALGSRFLRLMEQPGVLRACLGIGMRSAAIMSRVLVVMANLPRPDRLGASELAYLALGQSAGWSTRSKLDAPLS
jgi:geranylgeranyl reductase family protein